MPKIDITQSAIQLDTNDDGEFICPVCSDFSSQSKRAVLNHVQAVHPLDGGTLPFLAERHKVIQVLEELAVWVREHEGDELSPELMQWIRQAKLKVQALLSAIASGRTLRAMELEQILLKLDTVVAEKVLKEDYQQIDLEDLVGIQENIHKQTRDTIKSLQDTIGLQKKLVDDPIRELLDSIKTAAASGDLDLPEGASERGTLHKALEELKHEANHTPNE